MMAAKDLDPLDEEAPDPPKRDGKGRFRKGVSGNPRGRRMQFPRDPSLPASRRRVISQVADEEVEVKINGVTRRITMFEAGVRALAVASAKGDRIAAQKFIELATETSELDLRRRLVGHFNREYYDRLEQENERLREIAEPRSGVLRVPTDDLANWPPEGLIDDEQRVNLAMVRDLQERFADRDPETTT